VIVLTQLGDSDCEYYGKMI